MILSFIIIVLLLVFLSFNFIFFMAFFLKKRQIYFKIIF